MDYKSYRKAYFIEPEPEPRFQYGGINGVALFFKAFDEAVRYYEQVLGPPAYIEGKGTKGWRIGNSWLTLLKSKGGSPKNLEVIITMRTVEEAERLQREFIKAGGEGVEPSDQLMYEPIRACPVRDPFGTDLLIICPLEDGEDE